MRKLAVLILVGALTAAATLLVAACGSAPSASHCTANSDCTGDAVCEQNVCQQGFRLTASAGGDGKGRVTSSPDGIDCPGNCSAVFPAAASVTLRSIPDASSDFLGWTGACSGKGDCTLTLDGAKSAVATHKLVRIVFVSGRNLDHTDSTSANHVSNVWAIAADGSGLRALTQATAAGTSSFVPQWSPDGTRVVFQSSRAVSGADASNPTSNIWRVNADGSGLTPLTTSVTVSSTSPVWSPDGTAVAFVSNRNIDGTDTLNGANQTTNVWKIGADGSPASLTPLTRNVGAGAGSSTPEWSPDGTRILYISTRALNSDAQNTNGTANVWRVNATGAPNILAVTTVTAPGTSASNPTWSPDGTRIAFHSQRALTGNDVGNTNGTFNVWRVNADGTGLAPVTTLSASGANTGFPRWSPDGDQIVFLSNRNVDGTDSANANAVFNVWRVNPDGTGLALLTKGTVNLEFSIFPQWSPGSSRLLFQSNRKLDGTDALNTNNVFNVWRVGADGVTAVALTTTTAAGTDNSNPVVNR